MNSSMRGWFPELAGDFVSIETRYQSVSGKGPLQGMVELANELFSDGERSGFSMQHRTALNSAWTISSGLPKNISAPFTNWAAVHQALLLVETHADPSDPRLNTEACARFHAAIVDSFMESIPDMTEKETRHFHAQEIAFHESRQKFLPAHAARKKNKPVLSLVKND